MKAIKIVLAAWVGVLAFGVYTGISAGHSKTAQATAHGDLDLTSGANGFFSECVPAALAKDVRVSLEPCLTTNAISQVLSQGDQSQQRLFLQRFEGTFVASGSNTGAEDSHVARKVCFRTRDGLRQTTLFVKNEEGATKIDALGTNVISCNPDLLWETVD